MVVSVVFNSELSKNYERRIIGFIKDQVLNLPNKEVINDDFTLNQSQRMR